MALPRDVFKQKMEEGRQRAAEKRAAELADRQKEVMEKTVARREAEIKAQEEAYGGYSELSKPEMSEVEHETDGGEREALDVRVPDVQRRQRPAQAPLPQSNGRRDNEAATSCSLCHGFPWQSVPIEIARARFNWLTSEIARVGNIITGREAEQSRRNGCSICGGHPMIPDHWYSTKHIIEKATGVEYTLYACSQPCWVDWPRKYPQFFGVTPRINPHP